jgi:hypothetical protein
MSSATAALPTNTNAVNNRTSLQCFFFIASIPMSDLSTFEQYYKLADQLIAHATKEQLAECARLLALNLAHHQSKHGEIPLDETLALLDSNNPSDEQLELLCNGMENLVGVLGNVCSGLGEEKH